MLSLQLPRPGAPLRLLCLGAHCDDIEIGCGGSLLRLLAEHPDAEVRWVVFASDPQRESETRRSADAFLSAAARAEVDVHRFRESYFPHEGASIKDLFEQLKGTLAPDLVFTHHRRDEHQDHRLLAELTWNTFRDHLILEYEIPKYEGDLGTPNLFIPLASETARRKVDLLLEHYPSQAGRSWFRRSTFEAVMSLRGVECNAPDGVAEGFHCRKTVL